MMWTYYKKNTALEDMKAVAITWCQATFITAKIVTMIKSQELKWLYLDSKYKMQSTDIKFVNISNAHH